MIDPLTVEIGMKSPDRPLLIDLTAPTFAVLSAKMPLAHGGVSDPGADQTDKATEWLNSNSASTGPYRMVAWARNSSVDLRRNSNYWGDPAPFERVLIRHMADGATQLLAVRRGDIDIAMNLSAEQLDSLKGNPDVKVIEGKSIDTLYFILTSDPGLNPVLAKPEAKRAVAAALDYDGIINGLVGGACGSGRHHGCRSVSPAPPRRRPRNSARTRTWRRRSNCWRRPARRTASNSRSPIPTPPISAPTTRNWCRRCRATWRASASRRR